MPFAYHVVKSWLPKYGLFYELHVAHMDALCKERDHLMSCDTKYIYTCLHGKTVEQILGGKTKIVNPSTTGEYSVMEVSL